MNDAHVNICRDNIQIVLVRTQHPGNIGSTCRAMKNMGFRRLRLADPQTRDFAAARIMAPGAGDILDSLEVFEDLDSALADVSTVVGTTARTRHWKHPFVNPRVLPSYLLPRAQANKVAILFGQEDSGLDNATVNRCELLIQIPTVEHTSLNLSQAVLVVLYELMMARFPEAAQDTRKLSSILERERLLDEVGQLVERVEFARHLTAPHIRTTLLGMAGRMALDSREVGILLGLLRKVNVHLNMAQGLTPSGLPRPPSDETPTPTAQET